MASQPASRVGAFRAWLHRRRWYIRLAIAVALGPWFGHFAHTHWTGEPAKPLLPAAMVSFDAGLAVPRPEVDRTAQMVAAIASLPAQPTLAAPTTAPAGRCWISVQDFDQLPKGGSPMPGPSSSPAPTTPSFDVTEALNGPWTPATRHHLSQIVPYLELPATQSALSQIAALADQPWCLARSTAIPGFGGLAQTRATVKLLAARARYHMAEKHDPARAAADIETALKVAANTEDDETLICVLVGIACRALAIEELRFWPSEHRLTREQIDSLIHLVERYSLDARQALNLGMRGERRLQQAYVDNFYTKDAQGNGWFVLHRSNAAQPGDWLLGSLNLLSPLIADRKTAEAMVQPAYEPFQKNPRSYKETLASLRRQGNSVINPTMMILGISQTSYDRVYVLCTRAQAEQVGTIVCLALAAYKNDHGRYPGSLAELVPAYLRAAPMDPYCDQPLRYRLDDQRGYVLYSVNENGVDDGGLFDPEKDWPDWEIGHRRSTKCSQEWVLLPAASTTKDSSNASQ